MAVVWDSDSGSHHLEGRPTWPPLGYSDEQALPDDLRQEVGSDARLWLQPRPDGTTWIYEPGGRLLGVKKFELSDRLQEQVCSKGHGYFKAAEVSVNCPVCQPPRPIVTTSEVNARRTRTRRLAALSFIIALPLLAAGAWAGDRYYERYALDALLAEVEGIENAEVWGGYFSVVECGGLITDEPSSQVITARAPVIATAATELADLLEAGVGRIQTVRIAPWHRQLERARDRIRDHERVWIQLLRTEADALNELEGVTHRAEQKKILEPYSDWINYASLSISGTFHTAEAAFSAAVTSAGGAYRQRVDVIFEPDALVEQTSCPGGDS